MLRRFGILLLLLVTVLFAVAAAPARATPSAQPPRGEPYWDDRFTVPNGVDGDVYAVTMSPQGDLVVGGRFRYAEGVEVNGIARWDGSAWHSFGTGVYKGDSYGHIYALAYDNQGRLYVAGDFDRAGATPANNIAMWDGSTWYALASGTDGAIQEITIAPDDSVVVTGEFYSVGGSPAIQRIARWNGETWSGLTNGGDASIHYLDDVLAAPNGNIYLAGQFSRLDGVDALNIARWDGSNWHAVGGGANGRVYALEWDSAQRLYVGGEFSEVGGIPAVNLARWDGEQWEALSLPDTAPVPEMTLHTDGTLYVHTYGIFPTESHLWRWNGSAWVEIETNHTVHSRLTLNELMVAPNGDLYAGHATDTLGDNPAYRVARWEPDSQLWHGIGTNQGYGINRGTVANFSGDGERLYLGGSFVYAGATRVNGVAEWREGAWHALGGGLTQASRPGVAYQLATEGNNLYVSGWFDRANGQLVHNVARWDGAAWHALGGGLPDVRGPAAMVVQNGSLYVARNISEGEEEYSEVYAYDGSEWTLLPAPPTKFIYTMAIAPDGTLYAGGTGLPFLARYLNGAWEEVSVPLNLYPIHALEFGPDDALYLSAGYSTATVRRWNGTNWLPLPGMDGTIMALHSGSDGILYAAGYLTFPDDSIFTVAGWDGTAWHTYGAPEILPRSSANEVYYHAADDAIWVGGNMQSAGGHGSSGIARYSYSPPPPTPTPTPSPTATPTTPAQRSLYLPLIQHESQY